MNQNNKNRKPSRPGGGKNSNWRGLLSLISWALLLTIIVSYASSYVSSAGHRASSVEMEYGEYQQMVLDGQVEAVSFDNEEAILIITPVDGYTYTAESGTTYTKRTDEDGNAVYSTDKADGTTASLEFFTVQIESNDAVVAFLNDHGIYNIDEDYEAPMGFFMMLLVNMAPFFIILIVMTLVMSIMSKRGMGGMGGIGGVGKANAKVYMEKQTGVTFADVAGQDEAKESLTEIIDFLHNPGKYTEIGAKLP